jgi:hypothetical protein
VFGVGGGTARVEDATKGHRKTKKPKRERDPKIDRIKRVR